MKILIIDPKMTMIESGYAEQFNKEVINQITRYGVEYYLVSNENIKIIKQKISRESIIIVYNEHLIESNNATNEMVVNFLEQALELKAFIWPIAMDKNARKPNGIISKKQSYDIWEQLRCRNLEEGYLKTIAIIFSHKILSKVYPTFYCETGEIFLSHRRIDGEEITGNLYDKIIVQAKEAKPFRDVVNVKVGEEAQDVIDKVMRQSDVFIFIHTCESGKSDWILKELRYALLRNIPILWIKIDDADEKSLKIKPSDTSHLNYKSDDFNDDVKLTFIIDEILDKAFELIMRRSEKMLDYIENIKSMFGNEMQAVNQHELVYHISKERKGYHYPQRNIEQYFQIYGRTPTEDDAKKLRDELTDGIKEKTLDSVVILTNRIVMNENHQNVVFDNIQDFCYHWDRYIIGEKKEEHGMEIVISGAFPDSDEIYKQSLTDALVLFAKAIIQSGYDLTFGAHPTFQELFYEVVKEVEPTDYKARINMYISEWFLEKELEKEKEYSEKYNLKITDKKESKPSSLSEMRKEMIQRKNVKALVCLGGKIKTNKKDEGIREEIELAREFNIPVFIVGSVGGCSSEVAIEYKKIGWDKLNDASEEINQNFLEGIDYYSMAKQMISHISA